LKISNLDLDSLIIEAELIMKKVKIYHIIKRHLKDDDCSIINHELNFLIENENNNKVVLIGSISILILGIAVLINIYMTKYIQLNI
jgi:hypothetical protein